MLEHSIVFRTYSLCIVTEIIKVVTSGRMYDLGMSMSVTRGARLLRGASESEQTWSSLFVYKMN